MQSENFNISARKLQKSDSKTFHSKNNLLDFEFILPILSKIVDR